MAQEPAKAGGANVVFILDASNSMNAKMGGETKLTIAKRVLADLLRELPPDARVGLMAYGHRRPSNDPNSCTDVGVLSDMGEHKPAALIAKVQGLKAQGMTPIASALGVSVGAFRNHRGQNNHVVLVSDGVETCKQDPCDSARLLARKGGVEARVHVIGFGLTDKERKQLECISTVSDGRFFRADNADELKQALAEVKQVAAAAPKFKEAWREGFDGADLGANWEVLNKKADAYIVENGALLMLGNARATPSNDKFPNIIRTNQPLPNGDWRMTAKIKIELRTGVERIYFGLHDSKDLWVATALEAWHGHGSSHPHLKAIAVKGSGGSETRTEKMIMTTIGGSRDWNKVTGVVAASTVYLRLEKRGRNYIGSVKVEAPEEAVKPVKSALRPLNTDWVVLKSLTLLRAPKKPFLGFALHSKGKGEGLMLVDELTVEVPE